MKEYALSILKDHRGDPSSSRWIAALGFIALVGLIWIGVGSDPKQHKLVVDLANALIWLIIGCVAAGQGASAAASMTVGASTPAITPSPPQVPGTTEPPTPIQVQP
jgi:hypothetical protein